MTNPDPTKINGAILVAIAADSARFECGRQRPHMPSDLRRRTSGDGGDRTPDALLIRGFWVRSPGGPPSDLGFYPQPPVRGRSLAATLAATRAVHCSAGQGSLSPFLTEAPVIGCRRGGHSRRQIWRRAMRAVALVSGAATTDPLCAEPLGVGVTHGAGHRDQHRQRRRACRTPCPRWWGQLTQPPAPVAPPASRASANRVRDDQSTFQVATFSAPVPKLVSYIVTGNHAALAAPPTGPF